VLAAEQRSLAIQRAAQRVDHPPEPALPHTQSWAFECNDLVALGHVRCLAENDGARRGAPDADNLCQRRFGRSPELNTEPFSDCEAGSNSRNIHREQVGGLDDTATLVTWDLAQGTGSGPPFLTFHGMSKNVMNSYFPVYTLGMMRFFGE
jgi:hypothetical protein